jgi:hypothetical protein
MGTERVGAAGVVTIERINPMHISCPMEDVGSAL